MNRTTRSSLYLAILGLLCATPVFAQNQATRDNFAARIYAQATQVDNANRAVDDGDEEKLEEVQTEAGIAAEANYENDFSQFQLGYTVFQREFSEDSEEGGNFWTGRSGLVLSARGRALNLALNHVVTRELNAPDAERTLGNTTERQTFSATPSAVLNVAPGTDLTISGIYTKTTYDAAEASNFETTGENVSLARQLSRTADYSINLSRSETDYELSDFADFQQRQASIIYNNTYGRLGLQVQVGYSSIKPNDEARDETGSTIYNIGLNYQLTENAFGVNASRLLMDSSTESTSDLPEDGIGDDTFVFEADQIERTNYTLNWATESVCGRCTLNMGYVLQQQEYLIDATNNFERQRANANFNYTLNDQVGLTALIAKTNTDFDVSGDTSESFSDTVAQLGASYQPFDSLILNFTYRNQKRDYDVSPGYTVNSATVGFSYGF